MPEGAYVNYLSKIKNLPEGVKASFAYFFASVITSAIAYITTPIYTRLLSAEIFGQASVFFTWLQIFGIVAMFSFHAGVFNNGMLQYSGERDGYSFSMLVLSNIITLVFFSGLLFLYPLINDTLNIDFPLLAVMFLVFITQPAYNFWISRQRYEYKYKLTVVVTIFATVFSSTVAIICILLSKNKLYARVFGAEIPLIFIYIIFYIYTVINGKKKFKFYYWKEAFLFNLPLIPHYLSTYLLGSSDKIMISILAGNAQAAYYSVAHTIAMVVTIIWSAANASLVPFTHEKCMEKDYNAISRTTLPILTVFAVVCLMIILLAPELLYFMASSEYQQAVYVIPPIIGGVFFQVQYYMYANILYYKKKTVYVMIASLSSAALNIVLNYLFIPQYGYIAAGYTTIVSYGLQAMIDYIAMRKVMKNSIYNMKYVVSLTMVLVLIAIIANVTYNTFIIRYIILVCITIVMVVFRKRIIVMLI